MAESVRVSGAGPLAGEIVLPGDKSISHRVALLSSVAAGTSLITGYSDSLDCESTLDCVGRLGITIEREGDVIRIHGSGLRGYNPGTDPVVLDAGNSGSTIRMLSGLLAGQPFTAELDGDSSLRCRPMRRIIDPLVRMGARVSARDGGLPPLRISGGHLKPLRFCSPIASAQVKSCVLFAGLYANGVTAVQEPAQSRNHTELMLSEFGVSASAAEGLATVQGGAELSPVRYTVPGDLSSAAFFVAAAVLIPGSRLALRRVGLNPTRTAFVELLRSLGADIKVENCRSAHGEPVGDLVTQSSALMTGRDPLVISGDLIPGLIDEIPILAVVATQVVGRVEVRGAGELRVKESDRIRTVVEGLRALGAEVEEFDDGFGIDGPQKLAGDIIDCSGDHRIAMAFTVAGLLASGSTRLVGSECVRVSFPGFYRTLASVSDPEAVPCEAPR